MWARSFSSLESQSQNNGLVPHTPRVSGTPPAPAPAAAGPRGGIALTSRVTGLDLSDEYVLELMRREDEYSRSRVKDVGIMGYLDQMPKFKAVPNQQFLMRMLKNTDGYNRCKEEQQCYIAKTKIDALDGRKPPASQVRGRGATHFKRSRSRSASRESAVERGGGSPVATLRTKRAREDSSSGSESESSPDPEHSEAREDTQHKRKRHKHSGGGSSGSSSGGSSDSEQERRHRSGSRERGKHRTHRHHHKHRRKHRHTPHSKDK
eukprot:m51a1_g2933 hypothetical protein (264) ;mRNA; f:582435-583467